MINSFEGEYSQLLNLRSMTLFSQPSYNKEGKQSLPEDFTSTTNLAARDFFREPLPEGGADAIFKSPFLMSCIRLTGQSQ